MEVLAEPFTTSDNTIFPLAPNTVTYTIPKSSANTRDNSFDESSRNASIDEKAGMGSLLGSLCLPPSLLSKSILSIFSAANRGMAKQKAVKKIHNRFIISFKFDFGGKLKQDGKDSQRNRTNTDGQSKTDYQLFKTIIMDRGMDICIFPVSATENYSFHL